MSPLWKAFGYEHLSPFQRYLVKVHTSTQYNLGSDCSSLGNDITLQADFDIDTISTGEAYANWAGEMEQALFGNSTYWKCIYG